MPQIDFDDYAGIELIEVCQIGDPDPSSPNTFDDTDNGVKYIISQGSMMILPSSSGYFLFFSTRCADQDVTASFVRLTIQFASPQQFVRFRFSFDPVPDVPAVVNFYDLASGPGVSPNVVDSRSIATQLGLIEVVYDEPTQPVRELTITTESLENRLRFLEFYQTKPAHDIALALDGSGSMAAENKWGTMIEAADIFNDLYRELGDSAEGFGGVRFRWDCANALGGDQTTAMPAFGPLSAAPDIPQLFASDGPTGCTPIGEGVIAAANMVNSGSNPAKHIVLLTDGKNNRGRSVVAASNDPLLGPITVHTIAVGSEAQVDPVEITTIAAEHGGDFRQTTTANEILDFFVQILGDTLGKGEMASVSGDSVIIAPGTDKAIFLIAWDDPSQANDFGLLTPSNELLDQNSTSATGMSVAYVASSAGTAHAYFVVEGTLEGTWQFQSVPAGAERLVVEDLAVRIQWSITPQLGVTGQPITLTGHVKFQGKPFGDHVQLLAHVRRPAEPRGDLVARQMMQRPVQIRHNAQDLSVRNQVISQVLERDKRNDFKFEQIEKLPLKQIAPGVFQLVFTDTEFDGVYRFDLEAHGTGKVRFRRRTSRCATLVTDATGDPGWSVEHVADRLFRVTVRPQGRNKLMLGPFMADQIQLTAADGGRLIGPLRDNLDGSYTQHIASGTGQAPDLNLTVNGIAVGEKPLQASRALPTGATIVDLAGLLRKKYELVYTTGPFTLPLATHSIDWGILNNDSQPQTVRVTVFKCPTGQPKVAEPPGPLEVTIEPGECTHNANAAQGGFFYEIQVECNSQFIFPYASAWSGSIATPIAGSVVKSAEFIRKLD